MTGSPRDSGTPNLPIPRDDGACRHLPGLRVPSVLLPSTSGRQVDLSATPNVAVVYAYPHTGRPDVPTPTEWDLIPGARGCTPQSCAFRDLHGELQSFGATVYGVSTDTTEWQREAVERLHLPFELLSDANMEWTRALRLPTFEFRGQTHLKRVTLILDAGRIDKVFYPVFPADRSPADVLAYLTSTRSTRG